MFFDPLYFLYMIPGLILALYAQAKVKSNYNKYSRISNKRNLTGADVASYILQANGITNVSIGRVQGNLTDNFNPSDNTIYLSDGVYDSTTISAVGIAAHETGHALQYASGYAPIKIRMLMVPVCNFGSSISPFLIIMGYILTINILVYIGLFAFLLSVIFQLITLPVEFNASSRALVAISSQNLLDPNERKGARKVLSAAALTYVAALLQSFLILLYYVARFTNKRN